MKGWAVKTDQIRVATVAVTRRAAIVNWLYTDGGLVVMNHATDRVIEEP
ncbi:hypothetical protein V3589_11420 [Sinorhizobium fredii]